MAVQRLYIDDLYTVAGEIDMILLDGVVGVSSREVWCRICEGSDGFRIILATIGVMGCRSEKQIIMMEGGAMS